VDKRENGSNLENMLKSFGGKQSFMPDTLIKAILEGREWFKDG
jgi:hypothetical protein